MYGKRFGCYTQDMILILLTALVLCVVVAGFILVFTVMNRQWSQLKQDMKNDTSFGLIKQDLQGIHTTLNDRLDKSNETMRDAMARQFAASSRLIGEVTRDLTELKES